MQAQNTTCIHIYICAIYVCNVRYIGKYSVFLFHSFALLGFFVSVLCVALYLLSERFFVSFSFLLNRPTPPPFHDTESVATPFLNFFIFQFSKIFLLKKCGMIYLHLWSVYVGTECLHLGVVLCVVGLVFRVGWLCVVGWLCRVLNLYKLNISS